MLRSRGVAWKRVDRTRRRARHPGRDRRPDRSATAEPRREPARGGTPRRPLTRPSTGNSSATWTSSGARRGCGRRTRACSVTGVRRPRRARGRVRRRAVLAMARRRQGARAGVDLSAAQLAARPRRSTGDTGIVRRGRPGGRRGLPFRTSRSTSRARRSARSAFVADSAAVMREVARSTSARRSLGVRGDPSAAVGSCRRSRPDGLVVRGLVLRSHAVRRGRRPVRRSDVRRAPPDPRRPGPRARRRRACAGRPDRAGVARRTPTRCLGRLEPTARCAAVAAGPSSSAASPESGG